MLSCYTYDPWLIFQNQQQTQIQRFSVINTRYYMVWHLKCSHFLYKFYILYVHDINYVIFQGSAKTLAYKGSTGLGLQQIGSTKGRK